MAWLFQLPHTHVIQQLWLDVSTAPIAVLAVVEGVFDKFWFDREIQLFIVVDTYTPSTFDSISVEDPSAVA